MGVMPRFSICHATARPEKWRAAYESWIQRAAHPKRVEYALCIDERWGFTFGSPPGSGPECLLSIDHWVVWNLGRKCCVDSWNTAAMHCTGDILILAADDLRPPDGWDKALNDVVGSHDPKTEEFVVWARTGLKSEQRGLMTIQIFSRARYRRLGYALYPEYDGMYSDDEFGEHARQDGCVIDAPDLFFSHLHPTLGLGKEDDVYLWQNREEAHRLGREIFERRKKEGFTA